MKNYLTLIRKNDFFDLFKFGQLFIDEKAAIEFDGDLKSLRRNIAVRDAVFERCNQFDYTFSLLLAHFRSDDIKATGRIRIEEVENLFALDAEAKRESKISYDPRIVINDPVWPEMTRLVQEKFRCEDARKGAQNIWEILQIPQPISYFASILPDSDLAELAYEVQNDARPAGELSFWIYLLRYERHGYFPKNILGFFMDIISVFVNKLQGRELLPEAIESTGIYRTLMELQENNPKLEGALTKLHETEVGRNFFAKVNEVGSIASSTYQIEPIRIAIAFLILRSKFPEGFNLSEMEAIDYLRELFPVESLYALHLLGIYLGHSHTYDCLYDALPLPIFSASETFDFQLVGRCYFSGHLPVCFAVPGLPALPDPCILPLRIRREDSKSSLPASAPDSAVPAPVQASSSRWQPESCSAISNILNSANKYKNLRRELEEVIAETQLREDMTPREFYRILEMKPAWKKPTKAKANVHLELFNAPIPDHVVNHGDKGSLSLMDIMPKAN